MLHAIVGALLPAFVTLLLGVFAGWRGDEDKKAAQALNTMVLVYALPLLLFAGTITASRAQLAAELPLAGALLVGFLVPFAAAYLASRYIFHRDTAATALESLAFGQSAVTLVGFPVLTPLIGDRTTAVIAWTGIISNVIVLPAVLVMLEASGNSDDPGQGGKDEDKDRAEGKGKGKEGGGQPLGRMIRDAVARAFAQPVVYAPVAAILLVLAGIKMPADVLSAMQLLGGTVGGVSLFASGVILQSHSVTLSWPAVASALGRVLVVPGLAYLALTALHADGELRKMVVLALGLASAPMQVILATRYHVHEKENAALLLYSNVLCVPALAFFIWLTN